MKFFKLTYIVLLFSFFSLTALEQQGPKFLRIQKQEIQKFKQKSTSDINNEYDYIKISTDKDAPAIVPISQILKFIPQWEQKDYKHLILINRGNKIPYYVIDLDGLINHSDTLIFLGSRPKGDTTWTDHYAAEEPFFLYYNPNETRAELHLLTDDDSYKTELPELFINAHIERDLVYSAGADLYDSHTSDNEGWYWKELLPYPDQPNQNTFTYPLILKPINTTSIEINLVFKSTIDTLFKGFGSNKYPEYNIAIFFNGDSLDGKEFTRIHNDTFKLKLDANKVINGLNILQVKSYEAHPYRLGVVGIDYIDLKFKSEPYKYSYLNHFEINENIPNSFVEIKNLTNKNVVAIDQQNNTIQFAKSIKSNPDLFFYINGEKSYFSVFLNDSSVYNHHPGIHLVKIDKKGSLSYEHHYYYDETAFNKILRDATNEDVIIFAYNEPGRKLPVEFIKSLQSYNLNLKLINDLPQGYMALAIFQKNNLIYEEKIQSYLYNKTLKFDGIFKESYTSKIVIPKSISSKIYIASLGEYSNISITKVNKPYLFDKANSANVVVIYHNNFSDFTEKYIKLRQKTEPHLKFKAIEVDEIFNEFNNGKKSPYAIKNFLYYARKNWKDSLSTLVLIGNASWDVSKRMSYSVATDFVPSYGFPPADYWYSLLDEDLFPDINVGRISIHSIEDGENYYKKLVDYYAIPDQPWMKNFLFLSGGENDAERAKFARIKSYFFDEYIQYGDFCGTSDSVAKYDKSIGGTAEAGEIRDKINKGALWVNFLGHANQSIFDMDGWQVNKLNNYQKYSFFSTISCNTGAHADPGIIHSRNEDYVFFKDKGFIGSIGSSTYGWVDENRYIILRIVQNLSNPDSKLEYIGDLLNFGKSGLANDGAQLQTKFHNAMIGDPLLKLRISRLPNLYVYAPTITIKNKIGNNEVTIQDTTVFVQGEIYNNGLKLNENVTIRIYDIYNNHLDSLDFVINSICLSSPFFAEFNIANKPGEHKVKIVIDPGNKFDYFKPENKVFETTFYVFSPTLLPVDPQENWDVAGNNIVFRVINKQHSNNLEYKFSIQNNQGWIYESKPDEFLFFENYIDWKPNTKLSEGVYNLKAYYVDKNGQISNELTLNFYVKNNILKGLVNSTISNRYNFDKSENFRIEFNDFDGSIQLKKSQQRVKLLSVSGDYDRGIIEWGIMEVGNKVYLDARYYRGFNILVFPDSSADVEPIYRRFDTWVDGDDWTGDSSAAKLNLFLRDSVPDNSYIFIATSSRSFKTPVLNQMYRPENVGSMDTLRFILRNYGSKLIDSIHGEYTYPAVAWYGWKHSFVMVGKKGWKPGEAIEAVNPSGDTAIVETMVDFYSKDGYVVFRKIGPLSSLQSIIINSNAHSDSLSNYSINFQLFNSNNLIFSNQLLSNSQTIDLTNFNIKDLYVDLLISLQRDNISSNPTIHSINLTYEPPAEVAISKKSTIIDNPISTRDINNTLFVTLENISLRKNTGIFDFKIINNHSVNLFEKLVENIGANDKVEFNFTLQSEYQNNVNNLDILVNSNKNLLEQYYFNNTHSLKYELINDNEKPKIRVTFDDKEVGDADFVALKPLIKVEVYDNFISPLKDTNHLEIFVNGLYITKENTDYYYFNINPNRDNKKSELYFVPNNLEYGNSKISPANYLKFIVKDQIGNSDTLVIRVNVQQNNSLSDVVVYPNPTESDEINFKFNFLGRNNKEKLLISIFNLNGQLVNSTQSYVEVGLNNKKVVLQDFEGSRLPKGIYFYRLDVQSNLWTEPRFGMFIKI